MNWREDYRSKQTTAEEAVKVVKSGDNVMLGGAGSAPPDLANALCARYKELENVNLWTGITMYPFDYLKGELKGHINYGSIFFGPLERMFHGQGNIDNLSYHFSHADRAVLESARCNVMLIEVSEPDHRGYMSLGPCGIYIGAIMCAQAETVVAQVNRNVPYIYGRDNVIHVSDVDWIVLGDHPLPELPPIPITDRERRIGQMIAERVPDGACIQIGLGGVANAVGHFLFDKKDLGVHSEMITDSMVELAQAGVINNSRKTFHHGKMLIGGLCVGSTALYEFVDRNPMVEFAPIYYVNNPHNIAKNERFVSINNALTVDLTGQVASESIGFQTYSGTGGQLDFVRGAGMAPKGQSFLALPAGTIKSDGTILSRIVSAFKPGTAVTTPRADVMYVVTEYGIAELWHKTTRDRVRAMIAIAHPEAREQLEREAFEAGLLH
ncbi:MAG: 4-hydroxybutyrate CoA-transferase [Proteobacteria bacterium]|nr:4-hydroxybutyrate CoA-transferase [Pseudomonadota bacterium]